MDSNIIPIESSSVATAPTNDANETLGYHRDAVREQVSNIRKLKQKFDESRDIAKDPVNAKFCAIPVYGEDNCWNWTEFLKDSNTKTIECDKYFKKAIKLNSLGKKEEACVQLAKEFKPLIHKENLHIAFDKADVFFELAKGCDFSASKVSDVFNARMQKKVLVFLFYKEKFDFETFFSHPSIKVATPNISDTFRRTIGAIGEDTSIISVYQKISRVILEDHANISAEDIIETAQSGNTISAYKNRFDSLARRTLTDEDIKLDLRNPRHAMISHGNFIYTMEKLIRRFRTRVEAAQFSEEYIAPMLDLDRLLWSNTTPKGGKKNNDGKASVLTASGARTPQLPTKAILKYAGKTKHGDPVEFAKNTYKVWFEAGVMGMPQIKSLDSKLWDAIRNTAKKNGVSINAYIPKATKVRDNLKGQDPDVMEKYRKDARSRMLRVRQRRASGELSKQA